MIHTFILLGLLGQVAIPTLIFVPAIPVDKLSLLRAQLALNIWQLDLINNYGKPSENLLNIKKNTDRVTENLQNLSKQLVVYNNVILGDSNAVSGTKNLVIGTKNNVLGNRNYIFTSNFSNSSKKGKKSSNSQQINDTLVSDNWVGELGRKE